MSAAGRTIESFHHNCYQLSLMLCQVLTCYCFLLHHALLLADHLPFNCPSNYNLDFELKEKNNKLLHKIFCKLFKNLKSLFFKFMFPMYESSLTLFTELTSVCLTVGQVEVWDQLFLGCIYLFIFFFLWTICFSI